MLFLRKVYFIANKEWMKILLTGATGFVGSAVLNELLKLKYETIIATRNDSPVGCGT